MDNNKLNSFKEFVKTNSFLIGYVKRGKKSWQEFYEMYDLYGEDEEAWSKFLEEDEDNGSNKQNKGGYWNEIINMAKNVDVDKVQEGITSLQKTLGLFGELFTGKNSNNANTGKEYNPRPLYRRFED